MVPWLVALVVVLALGLLGLGAAYVAPMVTTTPGEALIEANVAAWNARDADAVRAFYTEDAVLWTSDSATPAATGIDEIASLVQYSGLTIELLSPVSEQGNLAWDLVHVRSSYDVSGSDAVAVFYLRDGKIAQHWVIWDELE